MPVKETLNSSKIFLKFTCHQPPPKKKIFFYGDLFQVFNMRFHFERRPRNGSVKQTHVANFIWDITVLLRLKKKKRPFSKV